jgi:hypothetical protein
MSRGYRARERAVALLFRHAPFWLAFGLVAGCASRRAAPPPVLVPEGSRTTAASNADVPDWVKRTPTAKGKLCAQGAVDPTFYRQDGRIHAAEAARNELARSVQVHINSIMYDYDSTSGGSVRQYIVSEVTTAVQDGVVAGAEILEYWFDEHGAVSRRGMTYALACMSTDRSAAELAEKLEQLKVEHPEDGARIEAVKERARQAFDDLERLEAAPPTR